MLKLLLRLWCVFETNFENKSKYSRLLTLRLFEFFWCLIPFVSTSILFFSSSTKSFVIARNSSPTSFCLNCEGEGSVMINFWEPSMNSNQFCAVIVELSLFVVELVRIYGESKLNWVLEIFLGFHCVLGDFWKRLWVWSSKLERERWNVFVWFLLSCKNLAGVVMIGAFYRLPTVLLDQ
jgi:hypothetical protein